jgi:hypothetical protein
MNKYETNEDAERRSAFYKSEEVKKFLKKNGIPRSQISKRALVMTSYPEADAELVESLSYVHYDMHPQQINIRDKRDQKMIISLEK